jgi:hypothetical protein
VWRALKIATESERDFMSGICQHKRANPLTKAQDHERVYPGRDLNGADGDNIRG